MKILFVTHDVGIYGASRSLRGLLQHYNKAEVHLLVARDMWRRNDFRRIQAWFGPYVRSIHEAHLPFDFCFEGKPQPTFRGRVKQLIGLALWRFNSTQFYNFIQQECFDAIHLNSLVLHPLIRSALPFVLHVRERLNSNEAAAFKNLQNAHGVIFIDESTLAPFAHCQLRKSIVLNNPIDMTDIDVEKMAAARSRLGDMSGKVVFSLIGWLNENKGTRFILENFLASAPPNARLLIVGGGEKDYVRACRDYVKEDERVIFWGEETSISTIYAVSDYILRGESAPCVGRTIYEGLFAGCEVVAPGSVQNANMFFDYERFIEKLHFYTPRDSQSFRNTLRPLLDRKIETRQCTSNTEEYVNRFDRFFIELTTDCSE